MYKKAEWSVCSSVFTVCASENNNCHPVFLTIFAAASDPILWSDELGSKEYIIPWSKLKYLCENIGPWILGIDSPNQYGQQYSKLDDCPYFSMDQGWRALSLAPASSRTRALWASSAPGATALSHLWSPMAWPTPIKTVSSSSYLVNVILIMFFIRWHDLKGWS